MPRPNARAILAVAPRHRSRHRAADRLADEHCQRTATARAPGSRWLIVTGAVRYLIAGGVAFLVDSRPARPVPQVFGWPTWLAAGVGLRPELRVHLHRSSGWFSFGSHAPHGRRWSSTRSWSPSTRWRPRRSSRSSTSPPAGWVVGKVVATVATTVVELLRRIGTGCSRADRRPAASTGGLSVYKGARVAAVVPAYNEELMIGDGHRDDARLRRPHRHRRRRQPRRHERASVQRDRRPARHAHPPRGEPGRRRRDHHRHTGRRWSSAPTSTSSWPATPRWTRRTCPTCSTR